MSEFNAQSAIDFNRALLNDNEKSDIMWAWGAGTYVETVQEADEIVGYGSCFYRDGSEIDVFASREHGLTISATRPTKEVQNGADDEYVDEIHFPPDRIGEEDFEAFLTL